MEHHGWSRCTQKVKRVRIWVTFLVIAGCSTDTSLGQRALDPPEKQRIAVTGDSDSAPRICEPEAVGELMVSFLHDVNRGEDPTQWFASGFEWYSMTEGNPRGDGRHFVTYQREELEEYFRRRAAHSESMKLLGMTVQYDEGRNISHLTYWIERTADDTTDFGNIATGKGAVDCEEGKILLLSMGMAKDITQGRRPGETLVMPCAESGQNVTDVALVCSLD